MKLNKLDWLRKSQFPLMLASATYPLAALWALVVARQALPMAWCFSVSYALLAMVCLMLPGKVRLAGGMAGCLILLGLSEALLPYRESLAILFLPAGYAVLLLSSLPMAGWSREQELHPVWLVAGLLAHVLAQVVLNTITANAGRTGDYIVFQSVAPMLFGSFLIFLGLAMLSANRMSVASAAMGRQRIPAVMRRWNVLLTLGLLGLVLIIAAIPGIARALQDLWNGLKMGVGALTRLLMSLAPQGSEGASRQGTPAPEMLGFMEEASEPSAFMVALEWVMMGLAVALLAVMLALACRFLYRRLRVLLRNLLDRLIRFAAAAGEDYVDEITDTRDGEGIARLSLRRRVGQRLAWQHGYLPPRERIRYRYRHLKRKHPEWYASVTAREAIPGDAAGLYERARYSDHEITEEDARAFEDGVRKV